MIYRLVLLIGCVLAGSFPLLGYVVLGPYGVLLGIGAGLLLLDGIVHGKAREGEGLDP